MTTESQPRRLRADAARNRQALIDAGQRLFAQRGLSVTLDDIAAEAGVNVATAYRHFANKHELATAVVPQLIEQVVAIAQDAADAEDPAAGLTAFFDRTLDFMVASRGLHDIFTPGVAEEWLQRLDDRMQPLLSRLVARAQAAGALRKDVTPEDLAVILQMLKGVIDIPSEDPHTMLRRYLELALAGLRPGGSPLPGGPPSPAQTRAAMASRGSGLTGPGAVKPS